MAERWLTFQELCLELQLKPKQVRSLIKRGQIVGVCYGYKQRVETDWRFLDPSEKYKKALSTLEAIIGIRYSIDLLATPLLSTADFGAITGMHPGSIRSLVCRRKLRPHKIGGYSLFTPAQLRTWMLRRERKEPRSRRARCEDMIRWCLAELERRPEEAMTRAEVQNDDKMEGVLRRLLVKREPERSAAIREFWRRYELAHNVAAVIAQTRKATE